MCMNNLPVLYIYKISQWNVESQKFFKMNTIFQLKCLRTFFSTLWDRLHWLAGVTLMWTKSLRTRKSIFFQLCRRFTRHLRDVCHLVLPKIYWTDISASGTNCLLCSYILVQEDSNVLCGPRSSRLTSNLVIYSIRCFWNLDQFICGISALDIVGHLCEDYELMLQKTVDIATSKYRSTGVSNKQTGDGTCRPKTGYDYIPALESAASRWSPIGL